MSDGFHSLTDSAANVTGLIGMRIARQPPDADHPYGHRKFETLAAGSIFVFLLLVVVEVGPPLFEAHRLSHVVKDRLMDSFPQMADAVIHLEPPPSAYSR